MPRLRDEHPRRLVVRAPVIPQRTALRGPGAGECDGTLIYDGDCAFCKRCVALLEAWDPAGRLAFVPLQDTDALAALPTIAREALEQAMHYVAKDGRIFVGAEALPALLKLMPGGPPLAWLFLIPGIPVLAKAVYRRVARNRHRLGCGSATCSLGR